MTKQKDLELRIREHMAKTGKSFTAARADVLSGKPPTEGSDTAVPPHPPSAPIVPSSAKRICPGCKGVLARARGLGRRPALIQDISDELFGEGLGREAEQRPAQIRDLVDDLEELAKCLVRGTADHAWRDDAAGCEQWMKRAAHIAWRDLDILGYKVEQRETSFELKLPERGATLPCRLCGRTSWSPPVTERQAEVIADALAQIYTMLLHGVVKYAHTGQADSAANMMGRALRQLRFTFIALHMVSRWRNDRVYRKVVEEWEWEPPFEPPSAPDDDDSNEADE